MVGNGGAKEIRRWLLNLSLNTNNPIFYWKKETLISLKAWTEVVSEGVEENVQNS